MYRDKKKELIGDIAVILVSIAFLIIDYNQGYNQGLGSKGALETKDALVKEEVDSENNIVEQIDQGVIYEEIGITDNRMYFIIHNYSLNNLDASSDWDRYSNVIINTEEMQIVDIHTLESGKIIKSKGKITEDDVCTIRELISGKEVKDDATDVSLYISDIIVRDDNSITHTEMKYPYDINKDYILRDVSSDYNWYKSSKDWGNLKKTALIVPLIMYEEDIEELNGAREELMEKNDTDANIQLSLNVDNQEFSTEELQQGSATQGEELIGVTVVTVEEEMVGDSSDVLRYDTIEVLKTSLGCVLTESHTGRDENNFADSYRIGEDDIDFIFKNYWNTDLSRVLGNAHYVESNDESDINAYQMVEIMYYNAETDTTRTVSTTIYEPIEFVDEFVKYIEQTIAKG